MKRNLFYTTVFFLALGLFFFGSTTLDAQILIAEQNFNALNASQTFTRDALSDGGFLTNGGASSTGPGLGFVTRWNQTRSNPTGPFDPSSESSGDFIGVNSFSGSNAPDFAPDGTPVRSGSEHNFEFNDADGQLSLIFDPVNVSGFFKRTFTLKYWIGATGYESQDAFSVELTDGSRTKEVIKIVGDDLEDIDGQWLMVMVDLDALIASGWRETITATVKVDCNAGSENVFVDDVRFGGFRPTNNAGDLDPFFIGNTNNCGGSTLLSNIAGQTSATLNSSCFDNQPGSDDLASLFGTLCGDGEFSARLVNNSNPVFAGIMFRESTSPTSKYFWALTTGSTFFLNNQYRTADNTPPGIALKLLFNKKWIKVKRTGNFFRVYASSNGSFYQQIGQFIVPMNECLLVGLAVHSTVDGRNVTASFDNIQFNGTSTATMERSERPAKIYTEKETTPDHVWEPTISEEEYNAQGVLVHQDENDEVESTATFSGFNVQVSPNPASNYLELRLNQWVNATATLTIQDLNGRVLYADQVERNGNTVTLDLDAMNLSQGMYMISVQTGDFVTTRKFVKAN